MDNNVHEKYPNEVADLDEAIARLKENKSKIKAKTEDFSRNIRNYQLSGESIDKR